MKYILLYLLFSCSYVFGQSKLSTIDRLIEVKKYIEAQKILNSVKENESDYAAAQFYLGRISFELKDYEEAVDYFEEAVEINPKVASYHLWLGNAYGIIAQDANVFTQGYLAPKIKSEWEKTVTLDNNNIEARWSLIQFYIMAPSIMGGSFEKAKEMASQIKKLKVAEGHSAMATILLKEGKNAEAEKELIAMVKADPTYGNGLSGYYINQKQYEKAFEVIEQALKENPKDYSTIYQMGKVSALSGLKLDKGEECLKKYLSYTPTVNQPTHAGAQMRLGQIYEKKGNKAEAKKYFQISIKADPSMTEAKEGLERLGK